ncbi:MAG: DUF2950 family protein [Planctomycetota bacterium]
MARSFHYVAGWVWAASVLAAGEDAGLAANEKAAVEACKAYAEAQEIYHRTDFNRDGVLEYAQTLHGGRAAILKAPDASKLPQPTDEERQKAAKLIKDLGSNDFAVREQATVELAKLGPKALTQLQAAQKEQADAEVLHRCRKLIEQFTIALTPAASLDLRYGLYSSGTDGGTEGDLCLIDKDFAKAEWPAGSDGSTAVAKKGYFFRVLSRQGPDATGGAKDYIRVSPSGTRNMTLGYALLAFPKEYGVSGKKCFSINNHGTIFERDFGGKEQTEAYVKDCSEFNPAKGWTPAD